MNWKARQAIRRRDRRAARILLFWIIIVFALIVAGLAVFL